MKTIVVVIGLLTILPNASGNTPSIADVNCLDDKEMEQLMTSHSVALSELHRNKLLKIINTVDSNSMEPFIEPVPLTFIHG